MPPSHDFQILCHLNCISQWRGTLKCSVSSPMFNRNAFCGDWIEPRSLISCAVAFVIYAPLPNFLYIQFHDMSHPELSVPGIFFVCLPVKISAVHDRTAHASGMSVHIFVVECVTISAPHSNGRQLIGVANVLSTINGTPCACAAFANFPDPEQRGPDWRSSLQILLLYFPEMLHPALPAYTQDLQT